MEKSYHFEKNFFSKPLTFEKNKLIQVGSLYCNEKTVIKNHAQLNAYELTIAASGQGIVITNGISVPITTGEVFLSLPGDTHGIISDKVNPLKFDFITFKTEDTDFITEFEQIIENNFSPERRKFMDERISGLTRSIASEIDVPGEYSKRLVTATLELIIISLIRGLKLLGSEPMKSGAVANQILCYQIIKYIDTHIYTMKKLSELTKFTNYNYSYLSNLFSVVTGDTLSNYFQNRRLSVAALLIKENHINITEVAELLNYSSIYTFSRAFKSKYGKSPMQYKKDYLRKCCGTASHNPDNIKKV